jgi:formylmethanofuran dehydrogenase subunit B
LLIYAAADLTCETHREMAGLADRLGATIDGLTSDTVAGGLLAAQRRGRATATLGELRHRADVVVFWGVDPTERYPRFLERFLEPRPSWSSGRKIVSVDVGRDRGPAASHERFSVDPDDEVDAVRVLHAAVNHSSAGDVPGSLEPFVELGRTLAANARYAAFVFDAEPGERPRDPALAEALIALVQALNGPTRAALFALRGGGNRNGFESLLTWQTGYPFAVDFATGVPVYRAETTTTERLRRGRYDVALVVGSPSSVPSTVQAELNAIETI